MTRKKMIPIPGTLASKAPDGFDLKDKILLWFYVITDTGPHEIPGWRFSPKDEILDDREDAITYAQARIDAEGAKATENYFYPPKTSEEVEFMVVIGGFDENYQWKEPLDFDWETRQWYPLLDYVRTRIGGTPELILIENVE